MKRFLSISVLAISLALAASAEPVVPWAKPQPLPVQEPAEKPLFERVMEEERRRKEQGLSGSVDSASLKQNASAGVSAPGPASNTLPKGDFKPLERGAHGPGVKAVQQALLSLGFGLPAGADGDYGGQTVDAVKAFQSSAALPLTGKLDAATYRALLAVAPPPGKMIWEDPVSARSLPAPAPVAGKKIRVLIDLSEHRLSVYDGNGKLQRVFPVASGALKTPTHPGVKIVVEKMDDPTALAEKLWPESQGLAFGKRLIDLNWYDPATGSEKISDEELHGTYELESIGSYASHGCMRVTNENIEWLYQNLRLDDIVLVRE